MHAELPVRSRMRYVLQDKLSAALLFLGLSAKEKGVNLSASEMNASVVAVEEMEMFKTVQREVKVLNMHEKIPSSLLAPFGLATFQDGAAPLPVTDIIQVQDTSADYSIFRMTTLLLLPCRFSFRRKIRIPRRPCSLTHSALLR